MKYELIWYNLALEVCRDVIEADNDVDAKKKGYLKYNGNPPAPLVSVQEKKED